MIDNKKVLTDLDREIARLREAVEHGERLRAELMKKIELENKLKGKTNGNSR